MPKTNPYHVRRDELNAGKSGSRVWREFFRQARPEKKDLVLLISVSLVMSITDNISPLLIRYAIDHFVNRGVKTGMVEFGLFGLLLTVIVGLTTRAFLVLAGKIETDMAFNIREASFAHLQDLSFSYYDKMSVGWIISRVINDVTKVTETIAWGIMNFFWGIGSVVWISIAMIILNWQLALLVLSTMPVLLVLILFFRNKLLHMHREIRALNSALNASYNEGVMGAKTSKTLVREEENIREFAKLTEDMRRKSVRAGSFSACFLPIMSLVGIIGSGLVLAVGGDRYLNGLLEMGTLYAFFLYAMRLWEPIYQISAFLRDMQEAQAAGERIIGLLAEEIEIKDRPEVLARYPELPKMQGRVSFKDLNFSYIPGEPVLENFNLEVPAGSTVAIVGETGAGKSTLVNLLCRFYEPQSGKIEIDGRDIREMPLAWIYHNLGYVLQTPHLFSGTIAENIRYGKPKASDEEVREAAKLVHADRFIQALPQGYDSQVGEAGSRLSTGQKQLISFARAVIGRPALFVLDEATSSVDTEAEKDIQEAIDRILSGSTAFIVAHRLSTIRDADIILLIEDGKICEQGDHAELMAKRGKYFNLYSSQFTIANKFDSK